MTPTELRGGRYVLVKTLGEGSQGETFEAVDKREGRLVAIKRFRVGKAKAWKDVELAEREATTLASLQHELLPRYIEHFEEEGALVLVMERMEGESLAELRKKGYRLSPAEIQRLLSDASNALEYLHGRAPPVVHRDLKPGNVIKRPDGSFAFVDFGAVRDRLKPAGGSTVVGTFGYMAPEQFQGRASAGSDVYGIGATALALLTGCEPEDLPHKGLGIDVASAVPASSPPWLVRTLEAMLEPDPDKRASSVREAMVRGGERAGARPAPPQPRAPTPAPTPTPTPAPTPTPPPPPRLVAWMVWLMVGVVVPFFRRMLAVLFRRPLGPEKPVQSARVRVSEGEDVLRRVRAVTPEQAQRDAMRAAKLSEQEAAEAWAEKRAKQEADRWHPPEAWVEAEAEEEQERQRKAAKRRS